MTSPSQRWGVYCERVVAHYLQGKGCEWIAHRYKTPYAECDLIVAKHESLHIIEVKKASRIPAYQLVSLNQALRLKRAQTWLQAKTGQITRCHLAVVSREAHPKFFIDFLCDLLEAP